ncbi:MAG: TonB family protein [Candidatus Acidiferrum sp.]
MKNWHACSWKNARVSVLFAALFGLPILGSIPKKDLHPKLAEFYAVDVWDDDYYPYWQSAILHITSQENGVNVQYVYIASATQPCNDPEIKSVTAFLPNTRLERLTNGLDLCLLDPSTFNRNVAEYTKKPEPFSTMRSAVVARCGAEEHVFEMPRFKMNEKILKRIEPSAVPMSQLSAYLLRKAFPIDKTRDIFWGVDSSLSEIPEGSPQLEELRAGAFDKAFWFGFKGVHPGIPAQVVTSVDPTIGSDSDLGKLRNILAKYRHPARGISGRTATLADSQGFKLTQYVAPGYSPLAAHLSIEGKVVLSLRVDHATGQVKGVDVASGHALFQDSAIKAAKQWQFDASQALPEQIKVVLDFSLHCGL